MTLNYVVLGNPVDHSHSPLIQNAAFDHLGMDATYLARRVSHEGLRRAVRELRTGQLAGANVTMPYKRLAASLADELRGEARLMGSCNTLLVEDGKVVGESTDPHGVQYAFEKAQLPDAEPVLILGAGGAAAAALIALEGRALRISARRRQAARRLVVELASDASVLDWGEAVAGAVVVNATPLGRQGEALPVGALDEAVGLLDMTYGPVATPAVQTMRRRELPVAEGDLMLVGQAVASLRLWTGVDVDPAVMLAALATAESGR